MPLHEPILGLRLEGPRLATLGNELGSMLVALDRHSRIPDRYSPVDVGARELRPGLVFGDGGELRLDLGAAPAEVERFLLLAYLVRGPGQGLSLRDFEAISVAASSYRFTLDLTNRGEAAVIMVEIYRRGEAWRLSCNGQGFVGGLPALRSALKIDIPVPDVARPPQPGSGSSGSDRRPPGASFSGSGFAVDQHHVLTNAHVIDGARKIDVANDRFTAPAEVVLADPRNDIALLRIDRPLPAAARFRAAVDIDLGEDVIVLGFPLQGLLGAGPQATAGNVSALCGIGNDTTVLQFSAPTSSGNSGGPILDQAGLVLGLVHSSLNLDYVREGGSRAENINFGVKGAVVRAFLSTLGIEGRSEAGLGHARTRAEVVREARAYIYRVRCEG